MYDVVETPFFCRELPELFGQPLLIVVGQIDKTDPFILEVRTAAPLADAGPRFVSQCQRCIHYRATDKPARAGNKNLFPVHTFFRIVSVALLIPIGLPRMLPNWRLFFLPLQK